MSSEIFATLAASDSQRMRVRRAREDAFCRKDARLACADAYDEAPNCRSFLLHHADESRVIGSIRACVYAGSYEWLPIPAFELYGDEIRSSLDLRSGIVQATHFCVVPTDRCAALRPKLLLIGVILKEAVRERAGHVISIITDQPSRLAFYARMGFSPIAPGKTHPQLNRRVVLIAAPTSTFLSRVRAERAFQAIARFDDVETPGPEQGADGARPSIVVGSRPEAEPGSDPDL